MARNRNRNKGKRGDTSNSTKTPSNTAVGNNGVVDSKDNDTSTNPDDTKRNDPEWYLRLGEMSSACANIPFSEPFGSPMELVPSDMDNQAFMEWGADNSPVHPVKFDSGSSADKRSVSGICSLALSPSFGHNRDQNDPLNIAANALYTHVRYNNNGRKNYDPCDLMLYALTFGEIYAFIIWCIRNYNYAYMYSQRNFFIGKDMLKANGVNPDDLTANLANFRYWLNTYINKVASFAVPQDIYYFKRRVFEFSNYYIENPYTNLKDQLYQFVPAGFMKFGLDTQGRGSLQPVEWSPSTLHDVDDIITFGNDLLVNITGDEDFGLMSGDILRAFQGNIIGLAPIPEAGGLVPVYDPIVLSQFRNAKVVEDYAYSNSEPHYFKVDNEVYHVGWLNQGPNGNLIYSRIVKNADISGSLTSQLNPLISVENPVPGVGDVVEATRLVPTFRGWIQIFDAGGNQVYTNNANNIELDTGTEVCVGIYYHYYATKGAFPREVKATNLSASVLWNMASSPSPTETPRLLDYVECASHFRYAPIMYYANISSGTDSGVDYVYLISNVENYALASKKQIGRIHEVSLLSLFYVPGIAKLIG